MTMGAEEAILKGEKDTSMRERRYRPAATRERILEAARTLFAAHGYVNTSTQEIAAEAGVAEGSIFYHFGSKKNLLTALGVLFAQELVRVMRGSSEDLSDLEPGITIARAFDFVEGHGFTDRILGLEFDSPEAQPFAIANREVVVGFISQCLAATLDDEQRAGLDVDMAASMAYAAVCDGLSILHDCPDPKSREHILTQTVRFVRQAMGYPHISNLKEAAKRRAAKPRKS
jgi:AcrR family transcriptional regulator